MNHKFVAFPLCLAIAATTALAQNPQGVPESPAIWREVTGVVNAGTPGTPAPFFLRPHIPAYRTTSDGRVGMIVEGGTARFGLIIPEKLVAPVLLSGAGPTINRSTLFTPSPAIDWAPEPNWDRLHTCLWDNEEWPQASGSQDRYEVDVVATARESGAGSSSRIRLFTTRVEILLDNPKTANASIASVTKQWSKMGPILMGPVDAMGTLAPYHGQGFEPTIAADGRLMVVRFGSSDMTWFHPATNNPQYIPQHVDIVYSYSDVLNDPANVQNWTEFYPISFAPYDPRIKDTLGFALEPFRDPGGVPILNPASPETDPAVDIGGSYPWIDRDANNLFMETIKDRLSPDGILAIMTQSGGARYDNQFHPLDQTATTSIVENGGKHQGICVVGKWTQGKIIQIDNLNNDMDYAIGAGDGSPLYGPQHRLVDLFQPNSTPPWSNPPAFLSDPNAGKLFLGYGRSTKFMPAWENDNANIIDSLEAKLNYKENATTLVYRDVVWHLNNSKHTAELVFDDYLDPDAFILSNMTGLLEHRDPSFGSGGSTNYFPYYEHHTGWDNSLKQFTGSVRLQNAAAPHPNRWAVPDYAQVVGGTGRVEPAATGGVHGKGFWLDGANGLEYAVPSQPTGQAFDAHDWYVGLFLDTREGGPSGNKRLIRFPDASELRLENRSQFLFLNSSGEIEHRVNVPAPIAPGGHPLSDLVPNDGWSHVGLQIRQQGKLIDLHLNGLPLSRWQSNDSGLFQMQVGVLTVGASAGQTDGFRGWIDNFKVLAHSVDLESACNHAGGTLIGLDSAYTGDWRTYYADRYPEWVHEEVSAILRAKGEPTFDAYACFLNYRQDNRVHRDSVQALTASGDVTHLRSSIHFPEGPRFNNRPRPDSQTNKFCLSCHHPQGEMGLDLQALSSLAIPAPADPRRQPSDPPRSIFGHIPAGLVDSTGLPTASTVAPAGGILIDTYRFPPFTQPAVVKSITLVDDASGKDLLDMPLSSSGLPANMPAIDPWILGTIDLSLRVNLDHGQDSVDIVFNGAPPTTIPIHPYSFDLLITSLVFAGPNTFTVTPIGGASVTTGFTIGNIGNIRPVANYRDDFQASSPQEGWLYGWNASGPVTSVNSFRSMNWHPQSARYTDRGLAFPEPASELGYGSFRATGGHPGEGLAQGSTDERFAMAGYRVKFPGTYAVYGSATLSGSSAGLEVQVLVQSSGSNTLTLLTTDIGVGSVTINSALSFLPLGTGDIIWVALGPNGNSNSDGFGLDYNVFVLP